MAAPSTCVLSGQLYGASGAAVPGARIWARIVTLTSWPIVAGDGFASGDAIMAETDSGGTFSLTLQRGATVWLECREAGIDHAITVPDAATADLATLTMTERFV